MEQKDQSPKWRRRKDARPNEIVEAALDAFAEKGFAATRLEDVAKRAGVSKGTLYLYFRDKEDLFKAVIQLALVPNIALAEARLAESEGTTAEMFRNVVGNFLATVVGSKIGAIPKLIIGEAHNFPDIAKFYVDEVIMRGLKIVATILQRGIDRGEIRPSVDPVTAAPVLIGPLLLLVIWKKVLEPHSGRTIDPVKYIQSYADIVLNGLLREPAAKEGRQ
ncbi:MAG: TetR family transcriptional regulator [Rhodospirillales bacterium]|jgi:AcrR family transcriptional regulator|nr:TetR family transcriptional regulator [Rhodospirillales bacterium]